MQPTELMKGIAGEHLVCFDLMMQGYNVTMSEQGMAYDLVLDLEGLLAKVQVKSTTTWKSPVEGSGHVPSYVFCGNKGNGAKIGYKAHEVDLFALVCLETLQVGYVSFEDMSRSYSVRVDAFLGRYLPELRAARKQKAITLREKGYSNKSIGLILGVERANLHAMMKRETNDRHGVYFNDITLEKYLHRKSNQKTDEVLIVSRQGC